MRTKEQREAESRRYGHPIEYILKCLIHDRKEDVTLFDALNAMTELRTLKGSDLDE